VPRGPSRRKVFFGGSSSREKILAMLASGALPLPRP
jgi:hypothetical protein